MYYEKKRRSVLKTVSWRTLATITTAVIVYIFTGELVLAVSIGGVEVVAKIILYFFHERLWNKITFGKQRFKPFVIWFTGLPGAGKSTLAENIYRFLDNKGLNVERLDGDKVRAIFPNTGFSKEDRDRHIKRVGYLASMLEKNGVIVISSFVSPYKESREFVRNMCQNFIEVHVKASLQECEKRDPKGLYKRARQGEIKNFTGIDDPYEEPKNPEVIVETDRQSVDESIRIIKKVVSKYLNP